MTHSHWELGQRLDQQMQVNALLGDHLGASRDLTVDTVTRIEQSMKRLETNMTREYGELRSELGKVKDGGSRSQLQPRSPRPVRALEEVQRQTTQHSAGLESRVLQQLGFVRSEFELQITGTNEKLSTALRQLEGHALKGNEGITTTLGQGIISMENQLKSIADKITSDVSHLQEQDDKHYVAPRR
eukprot:Skav221954  [mRNA]  locus=scaffold195:616551:621594:- [translate_table: standard]